MFTITNFYQLLILLSTFLDLRHLQNIFGEDLTKKNKASVINQDTEYLSLLLWL